MLDKRVIKLVENKAQEERGRFNLGYESKIGNSIFNILETKYDALIFLYPLKTTKVAGFTRKSNNALQVFINTSLPKSYQIFTAAHELYHVVDIRDKNTNKFILCDTNDVSEITDNSPAGLDELKANYFAASYLLPDIVVYNRFKTLEYRNIALEDILINVIKLQFEYEVPYKTIIKRLKELEVIESPALIQKLMGYKSIIEVSKILDTEIYEKLSELETESRRVYHTLSTHLTALDVYKGGLLSYNKLKDIIEFYKKDISELGINEPKVEAINFSSIELGDDDLDEV